MVMASSVKSMAQSESSPEANVIYYFTKCVEWPDDRMTENFVIGVYQSDTLYDELRKSISGRWVGKKRISIIKIEDLNQEHLMVSILFVGKVELKQENKIIHLTENEPVLIVTKKAIAPKGTCMNQTVVNQKVKLEINKSNITSRGLKVASTLLAIGNSGN